MAARSDRNRTARRDSSVQKEKATKATRRRIAAQAARAAALAHKQAGSSPALRRDRGCPVPAPPVTARGCVLGVAPAYGRHGRDPPVLSAPAGHPPARGGAGYSVAPYAPADRGHVLPARGEGGGDMSDSEDSLIHDPAGVHDDGPGHPGDVTRVEEGVDDENYEVMPDEVLTRKERSLLARLARASAEYEAAKRTARLVELYYFKASRCRNAVQAARYNALAHKRADTSFVSRRGRDRDRPVPAPPVQARGRAPGCG